MYGILQLACVVSFWVKVPMLLAIRVRSGAPWWFVILVATALGWMLSNASVYLQHLAVTDSAVRDSRCYAAAALAPVVTVNETWVENPCSHHQSRQESYKPLEGLAYGPLYLLCCSLPYWLILGRRSSPGMTPPIAWLAAAGLLLEWTAIVGEGLHRDDLDRWLRYADPYVVPPLSIALAFLLAWLVATQLKFNRADCSP